MVTMVVRIETLWARSQRPLTPAGGQTAPQAFNLSVQQAKQAPNDPATPAVGPASEDAAANVFGADEPAVGIGVYYPLHPGDNPYDIYRRAGVDLSRDNDDSLLKANLAATPSLDLQAFGNRPANPPSASHHLQPGKDGDAVTVLDPTRLGFLEQERRQLAAASIVVLAPEKAAELKGNLAATIVQELQYAGTEQAVPDVKALTAPIAARAPNDRVFQDAVASAENLYSRQLIGQGRTEDQLGKLLQAARTDAPYDAEAAKRGEDPTYNALRKEASAQLTAAADGQIGSTALGSISGRAGVTMTYTRDDPRLADAIRQGTLDAQHEVLVGRPVQAVVDAYQKGGAEAATKKLREVTDRQTMTPAQVVAIMNDDRLQSTVKSVVHDVAGYRQGMTANPGNPETKRAAAVMEGLAAACQNATYADGGKAGEGRAAVDRIAGYIAAEAKQPVRRGLQENMFQTPFGYNQAMLGAVGNGDIALSLSVAAATRTSDPELSVGALYTATEGVTEFNDSVDSLKSTAMDHAQFLAVPIRDWGGNSTGAELDQTVQTILADPKHKDDVARINQDGQKLQDKAETAEGIRATIAGYKDVLGGTPGFDRPGNTGKDGPDFSRLKQNSVQAAIDATPAADLTGSDGATTPTNTLWFQRSARNVVYQSAKLFATIKLDDTKIAGDPAKQALKGLVLGKEFTVQPDGSYRGPNGEHFNARALSRVSSGVSSVLFGQNAAFAATSFAQSGSLLQDGSYAVVHGLMSLSQAGNAAMGDGWLKGRFTPGGGNTLISQSYDRLAQQVDGLTLKQGIKDGLKTYVFSPALRDIADIAYLGIDSANAVNFFNSDKTTDKVRGVAYTLSAAGDLAFLMGPGALEAGVLTGVGAGTLFGLSATAWTGIGAVLMLVASGINTTVSAYEHSHENDGADRDWLQAMGVKPEVAEQLAKHATSFDNDPPTGGPFLTKAFKHLGLSQKEMVGWLNALSPKDADRVATLIKLHYEQWDQHPIGESVKALNDALLQMGIQPFSLQLASN
ncbi:hypothetical protein ACFW16_02445 [Inquilinus sp. NPDC058860]|uniref:hypothetical protein n=1 Tax=Inquilinus sp. NPDC058860 TaxID=3346652 RepID=UPI0036778CEE